MLGPTVHGNLNFGTAEVAVSNSEPPAQRNNKLVENIIVIITIAIPTFLLLGAICFCAAAAISTNPAILFGALACALTAIFFISGLCCSYTSHENAYRDEFRDYPEAPSAQNFNSTKSRVFKLDS